jgi:sulfur carrier protein ThiS
VRINFKTAGTLVRFLPDGASGNTAVLEVADDATPAAVMRQLGLPEDASYLVVLNGASVPKAARAERRLADNDDLSIMPPLKGG